MADWEDEEDAFLYGGSAPTASTSTAGASGAQADSGASYNTQGQNVNPVMSMNEQSTVSRVEDDGEGEADMDEGDEDEEEEEEEEEESDDDFQIIMDANPTAPPPHHDLARKVGAIPVRPAPPVLVKEALPRDSAQPSPLVGRRQDSASPTKPLPNATVNLHPTTHSTGSPIPATSRSPPPNLNDTSATYGGPRTDIESKPEPQPILDLDLDSIPDKKWRKPGAYLSDYFNYGFEEPTWKEWCAKQHRMRKDRDRERETPFHVFADRPLPEAWASLPMELKGMMMQTIMSSFSNSNGSSQQQQMMQGMMGPGMQGGMQGMMPPAMGGGNPMGNMAQMGMPMGMMGGPGQQHRGMNGGPPQPGMQGHDFGGGPGMQQNRR